MDDRIVFGATAEVTGRTLSGVAHTFGTRTLRGGRYLEFARGAFDDALKASDVHSFWNHDRRLLLGSQHAGTVRVSAEDDGLHYAIDAPETSYADDMLALIARGDLRSMSFGIPPSGNETRSSRAPDGTPIVTFLRVGRLFDISPVSIPAFESGTSISLHSAADGEPTTSQVIKARHRALTKGR
jgi:hypothetical protein